MTYLEVDELRLPLPTIDRNLYQIQNTKRAVLSLDPVVENVHIQEMAHFAHILQIAPVHARETDREEEMIINIVIEVEVRL